MYPVRWSWLHWWEANRDEFLDRAVQSRGQKPDQQTVAKLRQQACDALSEALRSNIAQLRAAAALALGQIGATECDQKILDLLKTERDVGVRRYALVGLGLLGTPAAQKFITTAGLKTREEQEAAMIALGLANSPPPEALAIMQKGAVGADPAISVIASWALSRLTDAASRQFLLDVIKRSENPWQACEIVAAMRPAAADNTAMLAGILNGRGTIGASLALHKRIDDAESLIAKATARTGDATTYSRYRDEFDRWLTTNSPNPVAGRDPAKVGFSTLVFGLENIYMARLKASAAIALGFHDNQASRQALVDCIKEQKKPIDPDADKSLDGYSDLYIGQAIMSLGRLGDKDAMPSMVGYVKPVRVDGKKKSRSELESPLRGYAALALGLYCRQIQTPQGLVDPQNFDEVAQLLAQRAADAKEEPEVRTAAVLGLGLSGRTENLKYLQPVSQTIARNDEIIAGFAILARGMLSDKNILDPARKLLAKANDNTTTGGILARRAAIMGLGVLRSQEGIPILIESWNLSYHSNREVCVALAMCQAYNSTQQLTKLMKEAANPWERAFAARSLGELFCASRPQRLATLLNGKNYMMRNNALDFHRAFANEFLYTQLLPLFGDEWK